MSYKYIYLVSLSKKTSSLNQSSETGKFFPSVPPLSPHPGSPSSFPPQLKPHNKKSPKTKNHSNQPRKQPNSIIRNLHKAFKFKVSCRQCRAQPSPDLRGRISGAGDQERNGLGIISRRATVSSSLILEAWILLRD
jgi:hypothetical protein